jgi:hypothetical protein
MLLQISPERDLAHRDAKVHDICEVVVASGSLVNIR